MIRNSPNPPHLCPQFLPSVVDPSRCLASRSARFYFWSYRRRRLPQPVPPQPWTHKPLQLPGKNKIVSLSSMHRRIIHHAKLKSFRILQLLVINTKFWVINNYILLWIILTLQLIILFLSLQKGTENVFTVMHSRWKSRS